MNAAVALIAASALAQGAPPARAADCLISLGAVSKTAPRFSDYPARREPKTRPARVVIAAKDARAFRSQLRQGAARGPNFAGHYTVVAWACGASCTDWAIVDARTGQVSFPPHLRDLSTANVDPEQDPAGLRYRPGSRLIAVLGAPEEDEVREGVGFYAWDGKRLNPVAFFSRRGGCSAAQ